MIEERKNQKGGKFDSPILPQFSFFKANEGSHNVRILPPTWDDAPYYGIEVFVHYGIGPDGDSYLCLDKMQNKPCPICEARHEEEKAGNEEEAYALRAVKRVAVWLIDRKKESAGPLIWLMPWTADRDLAGVCIEPRTQEVLAIDDPEEGFDIFFERIGSQRNTKYSGWQVARDATPIFDEDAAFNETVEFIEENPLPTVLQYFEYDHIKAKFEGTVAGDDEETVSDDDAEDGREPVRTRSSRRPAREQEEEDPPEEEEEEPFDEDESEEDDDQDEDDDPDDLEDIDEPADDDESEEEEEDEPPARRPSRPAAARPQRRQRSAAPPESKPSAKRSAPKSQAPSRRSSSGGTEAARPRRRIADKAKEAAAKARSNRR